MLQRFPTDLEVVAAVLVFSAHTCLSVCQCFCLSSPVTTSDLSQLSTYLHSHIVLLMACGIHFLTFYFVFSNNVSCFCPWSQPHTFTVRFIPEWSILWWLVVFIYRLHPYKLSKPRYQFQKYSSILSLIIWLYWLLQFLDFIPAFLLRSSASDTQNKHTQLRNKYSNQYVIHAYKFHVNSSTFPKLVEGLVHGFTFHYHKSNNLLCVLWQSSLECILNLVSTNLEALNHIVSSPSIWIFMVNIFNVCHSHIIGASPLCPGCVVSNVAQVWSVMWLMLFLVQVAWHEMFLSSRTITESPWGKTYSDAVFIPLCQDYTPLLGTQVWHPVFRGRISLRQNHITVLNSPTAGEVCSSKQFHRS